MWKSVVIMIFAVLSVNSLSAQKHPKRYELTGTVLDVYKGPIANAIILIDDQKTNAVTDAQGNYKLKVKYGAEKISVFTFGNGTYEEYIGGRNHININLSTMRSDQMDPAVREGYAGIDNGYGDVMKKNLTTEVSSIDGADKKYSTYSSIYDMIQREVSGVNVSGSNVIIQGSRDFNGFIKPLVVVDGVYLNDVPDLPPAQVESIHVLKSTAAAIYGTRAKGGAIIINTKLRAD
jgi:TonB-dependent starch-binding outer membrane protein SusC